MLISANLLFLTFSCILFATDKEIVWTSSNEDVVKVSNGILEAVGEGSAVITATVGGKSVNCNVTVNKRITYTPVWEKIKSSIADEYYLYIVSSEGNKVSGKINITYINFVILSLRNVVPIKKD